MSSDYGIGLTPSLPSFPPHGPDLTDRLMEVELHWRRDNGMHCLELLRGILDDYPWSKEAAAKYGEIQGRLHHMYSTRAIVRLSDWIAVQAFIQGEFIPFRVTDGMWRMKVMRQVMREWLEERNPDHADPQWATIVDVGGQQGEMAIEWAGLPGAGQVWCLDISKMALSIGADHYTDPRLHRVACVGDALPLPDRCADIVVLAGILEHVPDPDLLIWQAERILRPGGLIIIQVPYGGMERDAVAPASLGTSFRAHVWSINPLHYLVDRDVVRVEYESYAYTALSPHTYDGEVGDWVVAYGVPETEFTASLAPPSVLPTDWSALVCPMDWGTLTLVQRDGKEEFLCSDCARTYPFYRDIPEMIIEEYRGGYVVNTESD